LEIIILEPSKLPAEPDAEGRKEAEAAYRTAIKREVEEKNREAEELRRKLREAGIDT
jgi:hypothetical protein